MFKVISKSPDFFPLTEYYTFLFLSNLPGLTHARLWVYSSAEKEKAQNQKEKNNPRPQLRNEVKVPLGV